MALAAPAFAQTNLQGVPVGSTAVLSRIHIDNFGKVNDNYYRGAQPKADDYADLAALAVKTVLDLQKDGRSDEPGLVERAGMRFFRIPMTTTDRPTEVQIDQFFKIVNDPANQPVFCTLRRRAPSYRHDDGASPDDAGQMERRSRLLRDEAVPTSKVSLIIQVPRNFVYAFKPAPVAPPAVLATTIVGTK